MAPRGVVPTVPVKVMSPVPAVKPRSKAPSRVLLKRMLPLVAPVVVIDRFAARSTGLSKVTLPPAPRLPAPLPAPPLVSISPLRVILPPVAVRFTVPPEPPLAFESASAGLPNVVSAPTLTVPPEMVIVPAFLPPLTAPSVSVPPEVVIAPVATAPDAVIETVPPAALEPPVVIRLPTLIVVALSRVMEPPTVEIAGVTAVEPMLPKVFPK